MKHRVSAKAVLATGCLYCLCLLTPLRGGAQEPDMTVASGGGTLRIHVSGANDDFDPAKFRAWIQYSADIVSRFYGRFPVDDARLDLDLFPGGGMMGGSAFGEPEARIAVSAGIYNELTDLKKDWRLIHEMIHLAFPRVPRRHRWIEEGLATYLESIARARGGELDAEFVWRGFVEGMPHGLPNADERGLDGNFRWGRVYWGGATFCLYADIEIHRRTGNRKSLGDAMRGIVAAGLDHRDRAELLPLLEAGDRATGVGVLVELYEKAGKARWEPDLEALWRDLGVTPAGGDGFDDDAPLAAVRKAITGGG